MSDAQHIRTYLRERSEDAFRTLVESHAPLVYGTAFRHTGDRGAAEEVAQNVFAALARKAMWLQNVDSLAAWLHRATVLEARQWWRAEARRRHREDTAIAWETTMKTAPTAPDTLLDQLDEGLLGLREGDRQALLLRFLEGRNHREIGETLGIREDAARKRVDKGLQHLVAFFRARGRTVASTAALAAALEANAVPPAWTAAALSTALAHLPSLVLPWHARLLARLLGLSRAPATLLCVGLLLVPPGWQTARLRSLEKERQRLAFGLAAVQRQRDAVIATLAAVEPHSGTAAGASPGFSPAVEAMVQAGVGDLDPRLFRWDDRAEDVRVPKSVLKFIAFDRDPTWDPPNVSGTGHERTFERDTGWVSASLLDALGLGPKEQVQVQQWSRETLVAFRTASDARGTLRSDVLQLGPPPPQFIHIDSSSRAWVTPAAPAEAAQWRVRFTEGLTQLMGAERARVVLDRGFQDGSLRACFHEFGAETSVLAVSPLGSNQVAFYRLQTELGAAAAWGGGGAMSIAAALTQPQARPFDEAAARWQIDAELQKYRTAHPDGPVPPPLEELVEEARQHWRMQHQDLAADMLGRPLPAALAQYLREWQANPTAASPTSNSPTAQHP